MHIQTYFFRKTDMSEVSCSIIIPVFNQLEYTKECIRSILDRSTYPNYEIIVVDNGSTDGTEEFCQALMSSTSNFTYYRYDENQGFSKACNQGAKISSGEYLVFLNNDTIVTKGWLKTLVSSIESDSNIGIIGPKLAYPTNNTIDNCGYVFSLEKKSAYRIYLNLHVSTECVNIKREYPALLGACLLIRKELFFNIDMFSIFALEDIDLCLKAKAAGTKVIYEPKSFVYHYGSVTFSNHPSELLPKPDPFKFSNKWKTFEQDCLDSYYYEQDGFTMKWEDFNLVVLSHKENPIYELMTKSYVHIVKNQLAEAKTLLESAIKMEQDYPTPYYYYSLISVNEQNYDKAYENLDKLVSIDPNNFSAKLDLALLCFALGKTEKSSGIVKKLLENRFTPISEKQKVLDLAERLKETSNS